MSLGRFFLTTLALIFVACGAWEAPRTGASRRRRGPMRRPRRLGGARPSGPALVRSTSREGSTATMLPAFSPNIQDYYVACASGTNDLTVTAKASTAPGVPVHRDPATPKPTLSRSALQHPRRRCGQRASRTGPSVADRDRREREPCVLGPVHASDFPPAMESARHLRTTSRPTTPRQSARSGRERAVRMVLDGNGSPGLVLPSARGSHGGLHRDGGLGRRQRDRTGPSRLLPSPRDIGFEVHHLNPPKHDIIHATETRPTGTSCAPSRTELPGPHEHAQKAWT